jgi:hypothetical protein
VCGISPENKEQMRKDKRITRAAHIIGACVVSITVASCGGGVGAKGDSAPLISTVDGMVFQYELGRSGPVTEDTGPLGNTKWQLASITPKPEGSQGAMFFHFKPDGNLVETITDRSGSLKSDTYRYHLVGSTMIINKGDNDINARFKLEGNSLIMDTGEYSMLLKRVENIN